MTGEPAEDAAAPDPASTRAVQIEGLRKSFGTNLVLDGIDLSVGSHEVICLIGASGSGKSTLLRCINLLEPISAGRILLWGQDITQPGIDQNRVRRNVGIVFQAFNLFPHMTVLRNVTLAPVKALGASRREAEQEARRCWTDSGCWTSRPTTRTGCPGASSSGWRSPGPWPCGPG